MIVYNGHNHFNGVASSNWRKPLGEATMGVGTVHANLQSWLAAHDCCLWESTPYGYCGYESAAVSMCLAKALD